MPDAEKRDSLPFLNYFYYLAPVWFLVENFFWPNFRAGVVFGGSLAGTAAFYTVEAGIGAALWFKLPHADAGALCENVVYLVFVLKFILYSHLDLALNIDAPSAAGAAANYAASLPGMLYSMAYVVLKIKNQLAGQARS